MKIDIIEIYRAFDTVISTLKSVRINVEIKHEEWYKEALALAESVDAEGTEQIPRLAGSKSRKLPGNLGI